MTTDELRNEMRKEFDSLRAEFRAEEEKTRRRFDEFVQELKDIVKVVTDATVRSTERLEHENRIKAIEEPAR